MPTPNQPVHLEHLRFALTLERAWRQAADRPALPVPPVEETAKELILAARALRGTRSSAEKLVIRTRVRQVLHHYRLQPVYTQGHPAVMDCCGQCFPIPR